MKVKSILNPSNSEDWDQLKRFTSQMLTDIVTQVNGNLDVNDNLHSSIHTVTFTAANQEQVIEHSLARVPNGYILLSATASMSLYNGSTAGTPQVIGIKSSAAGTATIMVV